MCIKKYGRDAGKKAVITKILDGNTVSVRTSARFKERKCNIKHLEFLSEMVDPDNKEQLARALEIEQARIKQ